MTDVFGLWMRRSLEMHEALDEMSKSSGCAAYLRCIDSITTTRISILWRYSETGTSSVIGLLPYLIHESLQHCLPQGPNSLFICSFLFESIQRLAAIPVERCKCKVQLIGSETIQFLTYSTHTREIGNITFNRYMEGPRHSWTFPTLETRPIRL